ncbi:NTP transferase domain-containing protein [Candidatus Woesearchaeota archaeon]|nr:NTP transferase domain-containing protein [Candidatus Woesearchaeota archaeon]
MKVGFIITARLKSTRLRKKLLLTLQGATVIEQMVRRFQESQAVDEIIIATSSNREDDKLKDIAEELGITCFRGSEDDVIKRLHDTSENSKLDYIINITADCPLAAYDYIPTVIEKYHETDADLITSFELPHGLFIYGIKPSALAKIIEIKDQQDTEVWGKYFTETGIFKVVTLEIPEKHRRKYRLTLDYPEDYDFFKQVYAGLGKETYKASTDEIITFLDQHPEIVAINKECEERYRKRWEQQNKKMKLK